MRNILLIYRGQRFDEEINPRLQEYKNDNVVLVIDNKLTRKIVGYLINDYEQKIKLITIHEFLNKGVIDNMEFDNVIINGPYQMQVGPRKTKQVWGEINEKALSLVKDNGGTFTTWHPIGWRNISGDYRYIFNLYKSYNMTRIDMHDINTGLEVFNAKTPFDVVYITKEPYQNKTELNFMDGTQKVVDITDLEFIPNSMFDEVMNLVAKPNEEKVEVIKDSTYHTQRNHMSSEKVGEFKYPCVYSILMDGTTNLYYSNTNQKGHFNIPKLILGYGANPTSTIDKNGEYGVTQYSFGIVDNVENLSMIQKALNSEGFKKITNESLKYTATQGQPLIHPNIISQFRKDFWKEFV